jgi:glucose-6-phosphate dehydrogenase assembly protein OpcA
VSTPERIEHDLAALWREVAPDARSARAVMSNLVVFRARGQGRPEGQDPLETGAEIDAIVARHPARVVLIDHEQSPSSTCGPLAASVGVVVFGPATGRYAVEQVAIRSACGESSLPSIVRRLIRGDLPTSIWWTEDISQAQPLGALVTMGRQLVYDSRRWRSVPRGVRAVAPLLAARRIELADLNWRRLTPLRHALIHAAEFNRRELETSAVRIVHRPGDGALAWLLAGWFGGRLRPGRERWPKVEEGRESDEVMTITIEDPAAPLSASLDAHRAIVKQSGCAPVVVGVPHEEEAEALANELRALTTDGCLQDALAALDQHFSTLA